MSRYSPYNVINQLADGMVSVTAFGASPSLADNSTKINDALTSVGSSGKILFFPSGIFKTVASLNVGAVTIVMAPGAVIEHYPANDSTDCIVITGLDAGRTQISGGIIRGMQNGHTFGRDLIRIAKGDYVVLKDIFLGYPKRDFVNLRPTASNQWIENLFFENVKCQHAQAATTLSGAGIADGSATSFTLTNASTYPDYVPFNIFCEDEIMTVGALDKGTNTASNVTRGVDGTTAVAHTAGKKVQTRLGRDGFHFEIQGAWSASFKPFINQVTLLNCETRSVPRHTVHILNTITGATTAQKESCFTILNGEYGAAAGPDSIIRIEGNASNFPIENIRIMDVAIEQTEQERTRYGVEITGSMSGFFQLENCIIFGNSLGKFTGYELFPQYHVRDVGSAAFVPLYMSHQGVSKALRTTATLNANAANFEDVHALVKGEILKCYVVDQSNSNDNIDWGAECTTLGKAILSKTENNIGLSVVGGQLRLTNTKTSGNTKLEIYIQRILKATDF
jgi:hypothetical protein